MPLPKDMHLLDCRSRARTSNMASELAKICLGLFICPHCRTPLIVSEDRLICEHGHIVPITNGFPDFTGFSENRIAEKALQINFHEDEVLNEKFDEIVLRPYNYNTVHAESWLYHLLHFKKLLLPTLGINLKDATVLNCGCGGGFEAQFFAENGALVVGFDISQLRVEAAATRFAINNLSGFFYRGDASILPFPDNSFDLVLYHDSLHHVPIEEIPLAIREAARVSKVGVVLLEAHDSPLRMLLETLGLSSSIERAGNYVFRFRRSLMEFWATQNSLKLVNYSVLLTKKEHRPKIYNKPIIGWFAYRLLRFFGLFLAPIGNEACIIYSKLHLKPGAP